MCGIAGFAGFSNETLIQQMCSQLVHRGPDSSGYSIFNEHKMALGMRRLAVIDLQSGDQPQTDLFDKR